LAFLCFLLGLFLFTESGVAGVVGLVGDIGAFSEGVRATFEQRLAGGLLLVLFGFVRAEFG
jgi:hypothetical protein